MLQLNHQHLYYFWVVAREGSVTRACKKLFLTQPTISGQIIQLERSLGKSLFRREKNSLILTEEGRQVRDYAGEIFGVSQELLETIRLGTVQRERRIRVGIDTHITKEVALRFLKAIKTFRPDIQVNLEEGGIRDLVRQLRGYDLDILLSEQARFLGDSDDLVKKEVCRLAIFFVATPALAAQVKVFPRDLDKVPLLLPTLQTPLWGEIERFLVKHNINAKAIGHVQHADFMHLLALEGEGVAPLHKVSVAEDLKTGRLVRVGDRSTGISKTLWMITRSQRRSHAVVDHLLKRFRVKC
jgi:LysR family transcriptional regulator, transcriptional activator of nhaA